MKMWKVYDNDDDGQQKIFAQKRSHEPSAQVTKLWSWTYWQLSIIYSRQKAATFKTLFASHDPEQGGVFTMSHPLWHRTSVYAVSSHGLSITCSHPCMTSRDCRGPLQPASWRGALRTTQGQKSVEETIRLCQKVSMLDMAREEGSTWWFLECLERRWQITTVGYLVIFGGTYHGTV